MEDGHSVILRMRHPAVHNKPLVQRQYSQSQAIFFVNGRTVKIPRGVIQWENNHQGFHKICRNLSDKLRKGQDTIYLFMGTQPERLMSHFGNIDDPGMLFIVAVYLLQQKYMKLDSTLEISVSFVQINNGKLYDLLVSGRQAMIQPGMQNREPIGCVHAKIGNYIEFLKLLRTALFNNKERDLGDRKSQVCSTTFVTHFTVKCSKASTVITLVDWPKLQKPEKKATKTEWSYISKYGQLRIIYNMPTLEQSIETNLDKFQILKSAALPRRPHHTQPMLSQILRRISNMQQFILTANYDSLNHLSMIQQMLAKYIDIMAANCQKLSCLIVKFLFEFSRLKLMKNYSMVKCKALIGATVKTDGIKQFYSCRSYQSLQRQVESMTEQIEEEVRECNHELHKSLVKLRKSPQLLKCLKCTQISSQQSTQTRVDWQLNQLYRMIVQFYKSKQRQIVEWNGDWLDQIRIKGNLEKQTEMIEHHLHNIKEMTKDMKNFDCSFKQQQMHSQNNIFNKLMSKMDGKVTSLPRLLFKKLEQKTVESREEKKNRHLAKDVSLLLLRPA